MSGAAVTFSSSTWQRPVPAGATPERRRVVEEVARLVARGPGRLRVAVDGRTGAGKTTFGHELAYAVAGLGRPAFRASLDDFKRPWRDAHLYDRVSGEGYYRNAYDVEAVRRLLLDPFATGGAVALCAVDPVTQVDHSAEVVDVPGDGVLVVDGVFALRPELVAAWDLRVWLRVDPDAAMERGIARDAGEAEVHRDRYRVAEDLYLGEVDVVALADVVVDNDDLDRPRLVKVPGPPGR